MLLGEKNVTVDKIVAAVVPTASAAEGRQQDCLDRSKQRDSKKPANSICVIVQHCNHHVYYTTQPPFKKKNRYANKNYGKI